MSSSQAQAGKTIDRWLAGRAASVRVGIASVVTLGMASGLLLMGQAALLAWTLSAVVMDGAGLARVWPALVAMLPIFALRFVLIRLAERTAFTSAASMRQTLRGELLRKLQALGPVWLRGEATGALATHLVQGVEAIEGYYARWLPGRALTVLLPFAILIVIFPVDWTSGLVLLITAPLIPLFMILLGKAAAEASQRQWTLLAQLGARFLDSLQGITTLRLFNAGRREAAVVARLSEAYRSSTMKVLRVAFLSSVVLEFLATLGIAVVAVLVGFHLFYGKIPLLRGLFVLLLVPEFYIPLRTMGSHYHERLDAIAAAERIMEILDLPTPAETGARLPLPAASDYTIRFDDVRHVWPTGQAALDGLHCVAQAGRITALVGPSGAGKSTVLNLLLGFARPTAGTISINGQPLNETDLDDWRSRVAWVPQRPHVFAGTVLDNLRIARPDADRAAVRAAAASAGADAFIQSLPHGYDTQLGERGAGLSGGQIQRLALARAFLKDAPVLLLDEPTACLDADTEATIHDSLRHLARGRTVLLIAHRLATAALADTIVVMEQGRVVQSGAHGQLAAAQGLYRQLIEAQADTEART
ncbi:Transport ATP-binding protein CydD [Paraburkholderia unamae]|uniref:thiol reductant ABC exporter subunit CydD n=1 Tax=Paraburkholderia unamae TaxID=219649 RepID=UPI000DC40C79|nr:thiol reductant ABC exporter subunit CydD [Paraburkholderia unamae]RAR56465.1 ATP-binding cassette subfamily C protein CydD [Paraburkholderia unamae]CAG9268226.1 Transport ATP-binding protein CydD [Paraburkholderia unamae]